MSWRGNNAGVGVGALENVATKYVSQCMWDRESRPAW